MPNYLQIKIDGGFKVYDTEIYIKGVTSTTGVPSVIVDTLNNEFNGNNHFAIYSTIPEENYEYTEPMITIFGKCLNVTTNSDSVAIGDFSIESIWSANSSFMFDYEASTHSISFEYNGETVYKLDDKFLNGKLIKYPTNNPTADILNYDPINKSSSNTASGLYSHAEGWSTTASGSDAHSEGAATTASGNDAHAEGRMTTASGNHAHAEGNANTASGDDSHAEGYHTNATGSMSHAEGNATTASANNAHAEGYYTVASGNSAHSEGGNTTASGVNSHAEGTNTYTEGTVDNTTIKGHSAHAEGRNTRAYGTGAHAEGSGLVVGINTTYVIASGEGSHAEGRGTTASGEGSHAEGIGTTASGTGAHAEGYNSISAGNYSHATNNGTIANGDNQTAIGKFNIADTTSAVIIGNGTSDNNRSNLLSMNWNGVVTLTAIPNVTNPTTTLPTNPGDFVTKTYTDSVASGLSDDISDLSGDIADLVGDISDLQDSISSIVPGEANQNAFSHVTVGATTIDAASKTDTVEFIAGTNVGISPIVADKSVTFSATDTRYTFVQDGSNGHIIRITPVTVNGSGSTNGTTQTITIPDNNTTYTLTQDSTDGHIITFTPSSGSATTITIPDNDTTYIDVTTTTHGLMTAEDKVKLNGIETGANNYTLPQATASVLGGVTIGNNISVSAGKISITDTNVMNALSTKLGANSGIATLDSNGKVPSTQLPAFVDDIIEGYYYNNKFYKDSAHTQEITPDSGNTYIFIDLATNKTYRWSGTQYVEISQSLAIGETSSTAFAGDRGVALETTLSNHLADYNNPHQVDKADVGLGNVDNTSDLNKPISTATQTALDNKADNVDATTSTHGLMSAADKTKLDGIETGATKLLPATDTRLGGIKIGDNITMDSTTSKLSITKTNVVNALGYEPPTADTHYSSKNIVASSATGTTAVSSSTSNPYFNHIENDGTNNTKTSSQRFSGTSPIVVKGTDSGITWSHATVTANDTTSTASPAHEGTFTAVDSVTRDSYGHVTGINVKTITLPADNDTHYTAKNIVGGSASAKATANVTSNGVFLNLVENDTVRSSHKLNGTSGITITNGSTSSDTSVVSIGHTNSVTAGSAGPSADKTLDYQDTFTVPSITYDAQGHITATSNKTITTPKSYIYPVKGTQNASTNVWSGSIDIDALYDGLTIAYYLPYAGTSSGATLNLTLKDGTSTTGAINVYYTATTRATTHYGAGSTILLTYWSAGSISVSGTATTEDRWTHADRDADIYTRQTLRSAPSSEESKPILMSYAATSTTTANIDNLAYRNNKVYITLPTTTGKETIYSPRGVFYDNTDLSGTANNKPALVVGGKETDPHIEMDADEIQGKTNGTTVGPISINKDGGIVNIGKYDSTNTVYPISIPADGSAVNINKPTNITGNTTVTGDLTVTGTITGNISGNASSADTLKTARKIDGVEFNGSADIIHYGTSDTAAGTQAKAVSCTGYKLATGSRIIVLFTVTNTHATPQLNVNSTGAKAIKWNGAAYKDLTKDRAYEFVYDGSNYELVGMDYVGSGGISVSGNSITHSNSVTAGSFSGGIGNNDSGANMASFGSTIEIPSGSYDAQGHISATTTVTKFRIPNFVATPSTSGTGGSDGLMSATDKEKLNSIESGITNDNKSFVIEKVLTGNSTITLGTLNTDDTIYEISVYVMSVFSGTPALNITYGTSSSTIYLMRDTYSDLTNIGLYETRCYYKNDASRPITIKLTGATGSTGVVSVMLHGFKSTADVSGITFNFDSING